MPVRTPEPERDLIERCLRFANLRHVQTTRQVEEIFDGTSLLGGAKVRRIDPSERDVFVRDHADLRQRLEAIVSGEAGRAAVRPQVSTLLAQTVRLQLVVHRARLVLGYDAAGVGACCALALGFILDDSRGLTNRLGQCRKRGCGRFNLTFRGRPRFFCNEKHRLAFDKIDARERVRRHRESKKRKGA